MLHYFFAPVEYINKDSITGRLRRGHEDIKFPQENAKMSLYGWENPHSEKRGRWYSHLLLPCRNLETWKAVSPGAHNFVSMNF